MWWCWIISWIRPENVTSNDSLQFVMCISYVFHGCSEFINFIIYTSFSSFQKSQRIKYIPIFYVCFVQVTKPRRSVRKVNSKLSCDESNRIQESGGDINQAIKFPDNKSRSGIRNTVGKSDSPPLWYNKT